MGDPWHDEGFGGENDWDEGKESLETDVEEGFEDPDELDDAESGDDEPEGEGVIEYEWVIVGVAAAVDVVSWWSRLAKASNPY